MTTRLPIPKERLEQILAHCKRETPENMAPISARSAVEIIGALLAAHEQEPVAWQYRVSAGQATGWSLWHEGKGEQYEKSYQVERRPLYTHPAPVPAVPMAVAGFNAATAIRACMEEFPESMHDIIEECAQIAENTISTSHAKSVPAVPDIDTWRAAFEYSERQRDDGFNLHKCGEVYENYKTQERWESWLSSRTAMLNGGKS
ncbi:MAG: hypothetical protein E7A50_07630 [Clostridiales bacterium]|nr:hypothetical protein [Clostridiales bacterium]